MIKAIIIDMGGVYFEAGTDNVMKKIYSLVDAPKDKIDEVFRGHLEKEGYLYRRGKLTRQEFWDAAVRKLGISKNMVPVLEELWLSSYVPIKGMKELVAGLSENYRLVVFSGNIRERVEYLDKKYDFKKYFKDFVFSFDYGVGKEEETFYDALVDRLDCRPGEAVLIDDFPEFIGMAKKKGFKTVQFRDAGQLRAELRKLGVNV